MAYFLSEIHFWTLKHRPVITPSDIGCFTYHEKNEEVVAHTFDEEKMQYTEGRDVSWRIRNKRPACLKDSLKELEEHLNSKKCIHLEWLSRHRLQMILSNATVISLIVSQHTGDIDRIHIDKSLVGKLSGDTAADVLLTSKYMLVSYHEHNKIDFVHFAKMANNEKVEKLSSLEPKMFSVDVPGPVGRKLLRKFSFSPDQQMVICWWSLGCDEAYPWMPMTGDKELTNMSLLTVDGLKLELISYIRTPGGLVSAAFSQIHQQQILTVEQISISPHSFEVFVNVYEWSKNKILRTASTSIPLKADVLCTDRSPGEDKILLGCSDSSLLVYDIQRKLTRTTKSRCVPSEVCWHPSGTVLVVISRNGEIQMFDLALQSLLIQTVTENVCPAATLSLGAYFKCPLSVSHAKWTSLKSETEIKLSECCDFLAFCCDKGPVGVVSVNVGVMNKAILSPLVLVNQYITCQQITEAINILKTLDWNSEAKMCYACLSTISNHLLKTSLSVDAENQLQEALGCFYSFPRQLSEICVLEYRELLNRLARRFFHHLLRYCRFEKAFLLAVDIGARDLFMDLHHAARDQGEKTLAEVARRKADELSMDDFSTGSESAWDGNDAGKMLDPLDHSDPSDYEDDSGEFHVHSQQLLSCHHNTQAVVNGSSCDVGELYPSQLSSELGDEFTECFVQLEQTTAGSESVSADGDAGCVHVIHFGIV